MTDDVVYPSVELILDLHVQIVEEGDHTEPGVRSEDAIQSALQHVSEAGLESLLWLNLVQYANLEQFATFADELLEQSAKTVITMEMSVDATRGEL